MKTIEVVIKNGYFEEAIDIFNKKHIKILEIEENYRFKHYNGFDKEPDIIKGSKVLLTLDINFYEEENDDNDLDILLQVDYMNTNPYHYDEIPIRGSIFIVPENMVD